MRFFHLSDLHIGKHLHFYNMAEDQKYILHQIIEKAIEYRPDAIVIAGDIYDKSVPSGEAYKIFDEFLDELSEITPAIPVLLIAGNHDSAERLEYASSFLEKHHIYIAVQPPQTTEEYLKKITLNDEFGEVDFYLFPFTKPGYVRHLFPNGEVTDYESAFKKVLDRENIIYDAKKRNVIVAHQLFVTDGKSPKTCDSEQMSLNIGGLEAIDTKVIADFDYAALGHIHGAQNLAGGHIRYCGTPLKYSVSEASHHKSITMVNLGEKGTLPEIQTIKLQPLRNVRKLKGTLEELLQLSDSENTDDYVSIILTDDKEPYQPKNILEEKYSHILEIALDNARTRRIQEQLYNEAEKEDILPPPLEAFEEFYKMMNGSSMNQDEIELIKMLLNQIDI